MALLDDIKVALRVTSTATDTEIQQLIDACLSDMERVGIDSMLLDEKQLDPIARSAIMCFCKARYGFDNDDAVRYEQAYRQTVIDLMNSQANKYLQNKSTARDGNE